MELPVRAPFDLEATVRLLQRHPSSPIDVWDGDRYRRALPAGGRDVLCTVRSLGTVDRPRLALTLEPDRVPPADVAGLRATLVRMLGLGDDPGFPVDAGVAGLRPLARALRGYLYFALLAARLVERGLIRPSTPGRRRPRRPAARS
jgi:hypothetical protein